MKPALAGAEIPAIEPDIVLDDEEDLTRFGGTGHAFVTPGHTPGSTCVLLPDSSILAGDALSGGVMRARVAHGPMFATDPATAARSLRSIVDRAPRTVYVGHGGPLTAASVASLASR